MLKEFSTRLLHFAKLWVLVALVLKESNVPAFQELNVAALCALPLSVLALAVIMTACSICQRSLFLRTESSPTLNGARFWWILFAFLVVPSMFAIPSVVGSCYMRKNGQVKANMSHLTLVLGLYALDHGGQYPPDISGEARYYYPDGSPTEHKTGRPPVNPFTNKTEWPICGKIKIIDRARSAPHRLLAKGALEYCPITNSQGKITDYVIRGGDSNGLALYKRRSNPRTNVQD
jgi:hypothetical protein